MVIISLIRQRSPLEQNMRKQVSSVSTDKRQTKDINELREEALGPNPYLGYDRDKLGRNLEAWDYFPENLENRNLMKHIKRLIETNSG